MTGDVAAEDVVVRGHIVGTITGLRITLQAQCHVQGDISHHSLAIEQGAEFEGTSRRPDNPLAEIKAPTADVANSSPIPRSTERGSAHRGGIATGLSKSSRLRISSRSRLTGGRVPHYASPASTAKRAALNAFD